MLIAEFMLMMEFMLITITKRRKNGNWHESRMIGKKYKLEQKNIKKFGFEQKNEERNLEVEDISYCITI